MLWACLSAKQAPKEALGLIERRADSVSSAVGCVLKRLHDVLILNHHCLLRRPVRRANAGLVGGRRFRCAAGRTVAADCTDGEVGTGGTEQAPKAKDRHACSNGRGCSRIEWLRALDGWDNQASAYGISIMQQQLYDKQAGCSRMSTLRGLSIKPCLSNSNSTLC